MKILTMVVEEVIVVVLIKIIMVIEEVNIKTMTCAIRHMLIVTIGLKSVPILL